MNKRLGISVNYHLWKPCNFGCKYCYATFDDLARQQHGHLYLPKRDSITLINLLAEAGIKKITFAGGEPTLCPWLEDLIEHAKSLDLTTMLVTNGSKIDEAFLRRNKPHVDWIAISIDSLTRETNYLIGRKDSKNLPYGYYDYMKLTDSIRFRGYHLKINTVVSRVNYGEIMSMFINEAMPERWKILQVLPVEGQNDGKVNEFLITDDQFNHFLELNSKINNQITVVPESNSAIQGSYLMIDPLGRFFDDTAGHHTYSEPILNVGIDWALSQINFDREKLQARGGEYDW